MKKTRQSILLLALLLAAVLLLGACGKMGDREITGGKSMDDAYAIQTNVKYQGLFEQTEDQNERWFSFKTPKGGDVEYAEYRVTVVNKTAESENLLVTLIAEDGYENNHLTAEPTGRAATLSVDNLEPNTKYYLRVSGSGTVHYALFIDDPLGEAAAEEAVAAYAETELPEAMPTNQDDALLLQANQRYQGKYAEGYQWASFRTGSGEDVAYGEYGVTVVNQTVGGDKLKVMLVKDTGEELGHVDVTQNGAAVTVWAKELEPDTTYAVCIYGDRTVHYSIFITDPTLDAKLADLERATISDGKLHLATNMDDAALMGLNQPYEGSYTEGSAWIAFRTGKGEDAVYTLTLENRSTNSATLYATLYDAYGGCPRIDYSDKINVDNTNRDYFASARQDGSASSSVLRGLKPDTIYFICLNSDRKADFTLTISDGGAVSAGDDSTPEGNVVLNGVPGTSMTSALNLPLDTRYYGKYEGQNTWFAFTTTEEEDAVYYITLVNQKVNGKTIYAELYDGAGKHPELYYQDKINLDNTNRDYCASARQDGSASSGRYSGLQPNTRYCIKVYCDGTADYSIRISSPGVSSTKVSTSNDMSMAKGTAKATDALVVGTNQNDATLLQNNVAYRGQYTDGYAWVAFRTGDDESAEYTITLENLTPNSKTLYGFLFDEYGAFPELYYRQKINVDNTNRDYFASAQQDGSASSGIYENLNPNTTYYIRLNGDSKAEYMITINAPETEQVQNTVQEANQAEERIFETPFELNETQVRFVANEATYYNEAEAKNNLKPVADEILAHPNCKVLLAGTTAKFHGDQASCAALSEKRAQTVKNTLVEFGVPESQLIVKGLGFDADPFVRGQEWDANNNFVETEAAKNRRVVVLDADSDTGKQILAG